MAKIVDKTSTMRRRRQRKAEAFNGFKALFISDPDGAEADLSEIAHYAPRMSDQALVERLLKRRVAGTDRIIELFSTRPNITKRLRALQTPKT